MSGWDSGDGCCAECGDFFHLDDVGGYNPLCPCGCGLCRSCHDEMNRSDVDDDWYPEDDEPTPTEGERGRDG